MGRTIVNIVTEDDPISNYLFVKEMYQSGDRLMFISAKDTEEDLDHVSSLFNVPQTEIDEILLKNDIDELSWDKMCRIIKSYLNTDTQYLVNLAGGTTFIAMAVQQVFEMYNSEFYYVSTEKNVIVKAKIDDNFNDDDYRFIPINYRMNLQEYFYAHDLEFNNNSKLSQSEVYTNSLCDKFLNFEDWQRYVLFLLRDQYGKCKKGINITAAEKHPKGNLLEIRGLRNFLDSIEYIPYKEGRLSYEEIRYLIGGWFEEYMYNLVKRIVKPQDIAFGACIRRSGMRHNNELDVVFTKGNMLFVIECKTGVRTEHDFNIFVYKACALKEALLGVNSYSYIVSFKDDKDGQSAKTAALMDIIFCDRTFFEKKVRLEKVLKNMVLISNDNQ